MVTRLVINKDFLPQGNEFVSTSGHRMFFLLLLAIYLTIKDNFKIYFKSINCCDDLKEQSAQGNATSTFDRKDKTILLIKSLSSVTEKAKNKPQS